MLAYIDNTLYGKPPPTSVKKYCLD